MRKALPGRNHLLFVLVSLLVLLFASVCAADSAADLQRGIDACKAGNHDAALEIFNAIIQSGSEYADSARLETAMCYFGTQKYQDALAVLDESIPSAAGEIKREMRFLQVQCNRALRKWTTTETLCKALIADYPTYAAYWQLYLADVYKDQGHLKDAVAFLEPLIDSAPADMKLKMQLALAGYYRKLQKPRLAIDLLTKNMPAISTEIGKAFENELASAYEDLSDWPNEQKVLIELIKQYPNDLSMLHRLTMCLIFQEKYTEAMTKLQMVKARGVVDQYTREAEFDICQILVRQHKFDTFDNRLKTIKEQNPEWWADAIMRIGSIYMNFGIDYARGTKLFQQLVAEQPENPRCIEAKRFIASGLMKAGQVDEAVSTLREVLAETTDPTLITSVKNRIGLDYYFAGRYEEALKALKEALNNKDRSDEQAEVIFSLAKCYKIMGDTTTAIADLNYLIQYFPKSRWADTAKRLLTEWNGQ